MKYMNTKQASQLWNLTERRITHLCRDGRIPYARKSGKTWLIPVDAVQPLDNRTSESKMSQTTQQHLPLPIGISDYKEAVSSYYYVDKTLMIRDFLDNIPKVSLFTRPRRFGKTLNMDMLRVFFEKTTMDTSVFFQNKKIWQCGEKYRQHQGQYPVIFLSFKDIKYTTWEETLQDISFLLSKEYFRHQQHLTKLTLSDSEHQYIQRILSCTATEQELMQALRELSNMLHNCYLSKAPIIIIDEYDTPIQQGYSYGFYDKVILFMRNLFSGAFKDNPHLSYGFLTGILHIAKESIFSGMNNLKEHSIFDNRYSEYFGFTQDEVLDMMYYYGHSGKYHEICDWYDGYHFGKNDIYNPWSVINYIDENCIPKAYWHATGSNDIIKQIVKEATPEIQKNLYRLMQGKSIATYIDTSVIYPDIKNNPLNIYSFLLMAGYLKLADNNYQQDPSAICNVSIPNKEIFYVYEREILTALSDAIPQSTALAIQQAILQQDISGLQEHLQEFLHSSISYYDSANESFYHGLVLGLSAILNNRYRITSNREAGDGRFDVQMLPLKKHLPGIIIELKYIAKATADTDSELQKLAEKALLQIDQKGYISELHHLGIDSILKIGIAFHQKKCAILHEYQSNTKLSVPNDIVISYNTDPELCYLVEIYKKADIESRKRLVRYLKRLIKV